MQPNFHEKYTLYDDGAADSSLLNRGSSSEGGRGGECCGGGGGGHTHHPIGAMHSGHALLISHPPPPTRIQPQSICLGTHAASPDQPHGKSSLREIDCRRNSDSCLNELLSSDSGSCASLDDDNLSLSFGVVKIAGHEPFVSA